MSKNHNSVPMFSPKDALSPIEIGIASTPEEKSAIYRLRYSIYIEEMAYPIASADHTNKFLHDELDDWGILLYAKTESEMIGTLRLNIGHAKDFPSKLATSFCMDKFDRYLNAQQKLAYGSSGMIAPGFRGSQAHSLLTAKCYELYCSHHVQFGFCNCNFYLIPLHEHYGNLRLGKNFVDSNFGLETCFVLLVDDTFHLKTVNSPLFYLADKRKIINTKVREWFNAEFTDAKNTINSQLVSEEQLWTILCDRLGTTPNKAIPILHGLSEGEAKKCLHCSSVIVKCPANSSIAIKGNISHEMDILLSGKLHFSNSHEIKPTGLGHPFGVNGLFKPATHVSTIQAANDTEILVLSCHFFAKFSRSFPDIARKIIANTKS
jgi:hypothetical protein